MRAPRRRGTSRRTGAAHPELTPDRFGPGPDRRARSFGGSPRRPPRGVFGRCGIGSTLTASRRPSSAQSPATRRRVERLGLLRDVPTIGHTRRMKCLACGSTNLVEGYVSDSNGAATFFQLAARSALKRMFGIGQRSVSVHACMHCGYAQHVVEFTEKDREEFARFDNGLPSVTDPRS